MLTVNPITESKFDAPMSVEEARDRVDLGDDERWSFAAFAEGSRLSTKGQMEEVMLFLIYDKEDQHYTVFENWMYDWEEAVLIDGGRQENGRLLPPEQALAQWVAGFVMKSEAKVGSHSLRYRLIEG